MVHATFFKESNILLSIYSGPLTKDDVFSLREELEKICTGDIMITSIAFFKYARVVDVSVANSFAQLTSDYHKSLLQIAVVGLTPFQKLIYNIYSSLTHQLVEHVLFDDLEYVSLKYSICLPQFYYTLKSEQESKA